jgi:site-specific recombinase XerD
VKLRRIQEVAPATVDKSLSVLKAFFSWSEHQGIFNHNPIRKVKLFNANNERIRYLSDEEYERLLGSRKDSLVLAADDCAGGSHGLVQRLDR